MHIWVLFTKPAFDDTYREVLPKSPWNYVLIKSEIEQNKLQAEVKKEIADYPWNLKNAPISVKTKERKCPCGKLNEALSGKYHRLCGLHVHRKRLK